MIEIDGVKYYSERDLNEFDLRAKNELILYLFSTPIEERQDEFLVYNPKALRFWKIPIKSKEEMNKIFENGISLREYFKEKENDKETEA